MLRFLALALSLLAPPASAACLWTNPGANRFTGDASAAVQSYGDIPPIIRARLAEAVSLGLLEDLLRQLVAFIHIRRLFFDQRR